MNSIFYLEAMKITDFPVYNPNKNSYFVCNILNKSIW